MPSTFRSQDGLLARVNFPLYALQMLTSRHVLVAGGGGSSKTGVANGFVSTSWSVKQTGERMTSLLNFELFCLNSAHDAKQPAKMHAICFCFRKYLKYPMMENILWLKK